jgi:thiol-disulfide isomerase/thioredoxin
MMTSRHHFYRLISLCLLGTICGSSPVLAQWGGDTIQIDVLNYQELQERYFDIQSDTTYVINFWAAWCEPCRLEMPYFEYLRKELAHKKLKIVLVSIDRDRDLLTKVIPILQQHKMKTDMVSLQDRVSPTQLLPLICPDWSGSIPLTIIMNRTDGTYFETSFATYKELEKAVLHFLIE